MIDSQPEIPVQRAKQQPGLVRRAASFIAGALVVAAIFAAFLWIRDDERPRSEGSTGRGAPAGAVEVASAHEAAADLATDAAARAAILEAKLAADPEELPARKELAVLLLANGRLVEAHEQAAEILKRRVDDLDGLYVEGIVRLAMGQGSKAIDFFDRVLTIRPDHVPALAARGEAWAGLGRLELAVASWEDGLRAAGGSHREIERLLEVARTGGSPHPAPSPFTPPANDAPSPRS